MLKTDKLIMKEITKEDIADIFALRTLPQIDEYNCMGIPQSIQEMTKIEMPFIEDQKNNPRTKFEWKLTLLENGEFIGVAGMFLSNDKYKNADIFYNIHPDFWGCGYATQVARALRDFALDEVGVHRVCAGVASGNEGSAKVAQKIGMQYEGTQRKSLPIRGEWVDCRLFAIVEDDERK